MSVLTSIVKFELREHLCLCLELVRSLLKKSKYFNKKIVLQCALVLAKIGRKRVGDDILRT